MHLRSLCHAGSVAAVLVLGAGCAAPEPESELSIALRASREAARDSTRGQEAIVLLEGYIDKRPADPTVPEALMQLAILRQQRGDMVAAIADYQRLLQDFPASESADEAQFMIAFVREEHLQDLDGARRAYQAVIDNHPNSELVEQARQLLEHVGESPDEWVTFQEGAQEDPR